MNHLQQYCHSCQSQAWKSGRDKYTYTYTYTLYTYTRVKLVDHELQAPFWKRRKIATCRNDFVN